MKTIDQRKYCIYSILAKKSLENAIMRHPMYCYETNSQNRRKNISTPYKSTSLGGKPPLHYINEQFLDDSNEKASFQYIGVHGVTI